MRPVVQRQSRHRHHAKHGLDLPAEFELPERYGSFTLTNTTAGGAGDSVTVSVAYRPDLTGTGTGSVSVFTNTNAIVIYAAPGTGGGSQITLTSFASSPVGFTTSVPPDYANWLSIRQTGGNLMGQVSAAASAVLTVTAIASGATTGQQLQGYFTVHPDNGAPDITVTVTFNVGSASTGTLVATPSSFTTVYPGDGAESGMSSNITCYNGSTFNASTNVPWLVIAQNSMPSWGAVGLKTNYMLDIGLDLANLQNLAPGSYTGKVTLVNPADLSETTIVVNLVLTSSIPGYTPPTLAVSPASLSFTTANPMNQKLTVTSDQYDEFTASSQVFSGSYNWLSISPGGNIKAQPGVGIDVVATVNPISLTPGQQYTGEIDLTLYGTTRKVPVTLTVPGGVTGGNIKVTGGSGAAVSSLAFTGQAGGPTLPAQQITISSASGASAIAFSYSTSASWLLVKNSQTGQGATPATLPVTVSAGSLGVGSYQGTVTITPTGGTPVAISVNLSVTPAPFLSATPASIPLTYTIGGPVPQPQTIQVSGNGGSLPFTATATSGGNWLAVSPASGTTSAGGATPLTVSFANLGALPPGQSYAGTILVTGSGSAANSTMVTVSLAVMPPLPTIAKVTNAASFTSGAIAAGEIITIFGTALGPDTGVAVTQDLIVKGQMPTALGGVQVLVNGYAAPLLYAGATQISAIVPYEINSPAYVRNLNVTVKYLGQTSNGVSTTQAPAAPGIFTANSSGNGPGAILNPDSSTNSSDRPAHPGEIVVLYLTGEGQTIPGGISGRITPAMAPFTEPVLAPMVTIDGQPATVVFYGEAPGMVAGVLQVNVQVPSGARAGDLPVSVKIGDAATQTTEDGTGAVTVSVR